MTEELSDATIAELAERLLYAREHQEPIPPITSRHPSMSVADAYRVQSEITRRLLSRGDKIIGWKLGLTSKPMQQMMGVAQPDFGPVMNSMLVDDGDCVPLSALIQPKVEGEIAFVLRKPLEGPGVTTADVLNAIAGVVPAIEIIDSRIEGWRIGLADTIADLASSSHVVLAGRLIPVEDIDLRLVGMALYQGGTAVASGAGAAALGNPVHAVAWAANMLSRFGVHLEPGQIVMSGAIHRAVDVPGNRSAFRAVFDRLGPVSVCFG